MSSKNVSIVWIPLLGLFGLIFWYRLPPQFFITFQEKTEEVFNQGDIALASNDAVEESEPEKSTFEEAVRAAIAASEKTQTSTTPEEWLEVSSLWSSAVSLMQSVPETNENHGTAQSKVIEYQSNLAYAQKALDLAKQKANPSDIPVPVNTSPRASEAKPGGKRFIGTGPTGYSLWEGNDRCIYVKDLREGDLSRLNTSISEFKRSVKEETGSSCVFFE